MNGKGDKTRPLSVDKQTFNTNWDAIFGKRKKTIIEQWKDICDTATIEQCNAFIANLSVGDQKDLAEYISKNSLDFV